MGGRSVGFSPVFYPGTPREQEAVEFTLSAGQELERHQPAAHARPDGASRGPRLRAERPAGRQRATVAAADQPAPRRRSISVRQQDGIFQAVGVPAGRYTLVGVDGSAAQQAPARRRNRGPATQLWAQQEIDVNGEDQLNLTLTLAPMLTFTGRVVFDGATPPEMRDVRVQLEPAGSAPRRNSPAGVSPDQNGAFTITAVVPGKYRLSASASSAAPGTDVGHVSAQIDGQDALVTPFEIRADRQASNVVVTLTDRPAEIAGKLIDGTDRPVAGMTIVLFPTDRTDMDGELVARQSHARDPGRTARTDSLRRCRASTTSSC